jgi:pantoate--beta-alanine ligase
MLRVETVAALRDAVASAARPLGLVPTMGALHAGHRSLLSRARAESATVAATIFVNPTQFGPGEDLGRYPRPIEDDLRALADAGTDLVFTPSVAEMYLPGAVTTVHVGGPALPLEGEMRPGHFDGVATIVTKLLLEARPDTAYFGQKDGQQIAVIRRLVADLDVPVEIVAVPTVREADGVAVSSRNAHLTPAQRAAAPAVYRALAAARDRYRSGNHSRDELEAACGSLLALEPAIDAVDYVAAVDADTMAPWAGEGACMLAVAVRMGSVRLIDNVIMD